MTNENNGEIKGDMPKLEATRIYGYSPYDIEQMREVPLTLNRDDFIVFLNSIADKYPFMVIMGLRVLKEITVKEILKQEGIPYNEKKDTLSPLLIKLRDKKVISEGMYNSLNGLVKLENTAAHGYEISVDWARLALNTIPDNLNDLRKVANQI
ncbi:MAG: hypothetical protein HQL03_07925 [Nitrospirae bacterium]|nr:hypothetical protein [Nitrospirota bacterium]